MKPVIIGITGGIGGGKSMFSRCLMRHGEMVYDADMEAKILQNCDDALKIQLKTAFGDDIYTSAGLDRGKLARIVFSDPEKLRLVNSIVHPAVIEDFKKWITRNSHRKFLFMESAILFESKLNHLMNKIVVVTAPQEVRIERVMRRDCVDRESVIARMKNQMQEEEKIKLADWTFDTDNDIFPHQRVDDFLKELYELSTL